MYTSYGLTYHDINQCTQNMGLHTLINQCTQAMGLHTLTSTNVHKLWDYIPCHLPMYTSYGLTYHDINQCTQALRLYTLINQCTQAMD